MSWAKDEWKQELPPKALQKIGDMEKEYENLEKLRQQQELKIDGYVTSLEKGKMDLEEERSSSANLRKQLQELTLKISNLEAKEERYLNEIKNKQKGVEYGEELLEKTKQKLKVENAKVVELEKSLEKQSTEAEKYAERSDKMAVDIGNLKQEKAHISKENDNYKERIGALTKELQTLRQIMSENEQKTMEVAQENEKDNDESCSQEPAAAGHRSDAFLEILRRENVSLLNEVEQLRSQREQMKHIIEEKTHEIEKGVTKVAELRKEVQDMRRDLKTSKGKISRLEASVESREREVTNLKEKVAKYKANEEKMQHEIRMLVWKDQLKDQDEHDGTAKGSKCLETADGAENETRDGLKDVQATTTTAEATENKLRQQLSKENESLREQIRFLREINSALEESVKDKEDRLKMYLDDKQEQIKKEEARLERVENLLLENTRLKERIKELENEAKGLSAGVNVCARCEQVMMSNEKPNQENSAVEKMEITVDEDSANEETLTKADATPEAAEDGGAIDVTMTDSTEVDEGLQEKHLHAESSINKDNDDDDDDDKEEKEEEEEEEDGVISCSDAADHNSSLQHAILQVLLSLSTVQMEHEMVQRGVNKCYKIVKQTMQLVDSQVSCTEKQDISAVVYSNVQSLYSQLRDVKGVGQRCASRTKAQMESIAGYLEKIKERNTEVHDDQKDSRSPGRKLSWDNFESERAFQTFKATVDPLIKEIEDEGEAKECQDLQTTTNKLSDLNQVSQVDEQVNTDDLHMGPESILDGNTLQLDGVFDVLRTLMDENNDVLAERIESLLQDFETNIMKNIAAIQRGMQQNKQKVPLSAENSDSEEDTNATKEEKLVLEELELMKRRISGVQKLVKHLMSSIESTKQEKEEADSHIDLLATQMRQISSHHEIRYTELERNLRTVSERELALQRQIKDLQTEKEGMSSSYKESFENLRQKEQELDRATQEIKNIQAKSQENEQKLRNKIEILQNEKEDISCNYKESFENLRQKKQELAKLSQEIKNIHAKSKENEQKLKNKIEVLQGEKTCVWHDYMEASREAREKKSEIDALVAKMKKTEVSLMSLFNTIGNIDDFLQRAKEMNLFQ